MHGTLFVIMDHLALQSRITQASDRSKDVSKSNASSFRTNLGLSHKNIAKKSLSMCCCNGPFPH